MQQTKQMIYYKSLNSKVYWKYKTFLEYDFEIIKLEDICREEKYCYGIEQYIKNFEECIKEKIIRYLPNLDEMEITCGIFDKNNLFHRLTISVFELMSKFLRNKLTKINYYKSIFIVIKYQDKISFIGSLNFDGLI
jgi:hypothetical protein